MSPRSSTRRQLGVTHRHCSPNISRTQAEEFAREGVLFESLDAFVHALLGSEDVSTDEDSDAEELDEAELEHHN